MGRPGESQDDAPVIGNQLVQLSSGPEAEHVSADPLDREQLQLGSDCQLTLPRPAREVGLDGPGQPGR
jgi:hypothetical protein